MPAVTAAEAGGLAGLERVLVHQDAEVVASHGPSGHHTRLILYGPHGRTECVRHGSGATLPEALADLWYGALGVWRWFDAEGWAASQRPAQAGNPGPLAGQALGRGDG